MLVATAALSFIAPIAAQASDINVDIMNSYSRNKSSIKKQKFNSKTFINEVATFQENVDNSLVDTKGFEASSFSETTTFDGKAVMALGAIDGNSTLGKGEAIGLATVYQINLNSSFTGDDNLYVRLKAGDGWTGVWDNKPATYHIEAKETSSGENTLLNLDKMWYTFPVGGNVTATVGPMIENYYMLAATPSVYKPGALKAFKLGGHGAAFGASTSAGAGLTYKADNGFASSVTVNSKKADTTGGFFTKEDQNKVNAQVAYTQDNYHLSATFTNQRGWNSWSYFATKDAVGSEAGDTGVTPTKSNGVALRAWWRPEETGTTTPSISVGYDVLDFGNTRTVDKVGEISGYTVGLNWDDIFRPDDKIGLAVGQPMKVTKSNDGSALTEVDSFLWEAYYSFRPNDSIEVTPAIFGGTDVYENTDEDLFGAVLTTTFKF